MTPQEKVLDVGPRVEDLVSDDADDAAMRENWAGKYQVVPSVGAHIHQQPVRHCLINHGNTLP